MLVLCFSHITFRLISLSRSSPGSGLAYPRNLFVATILAALSLGAYGGGSRRCSCRTVVDVRLVLDRAAERDRRRKGGEQGRERAGLPLRPKVR